MQLSTLQIDRAEVERKLAAMEPRKLGAKIRTVAGSVVFVAAFFLPKLGYPYWAGLLVAGFGGFVASQGLVTNYAKLLLSSIPLFRKPQ